MAKRKFICGGFDFFVSDAFLFCRNAPCYAVIGYVENVAALRIISEGCCEGRCEISGAVWFCELEFAQADVGEPYI